MKLLVLNLTRVEELSETYDIAITPPSLNWTGWFLFEKSGIYTIAYRLLTSML